VSISGLYRDPAELAAAARLVEDERRVHLHGRIAIGAGHGERPQARADQGQSTPRTMSAARATASAAVTGA